MSGVQEVAKIGEGMMMVHLEGVHRLEGVPHLEEALHQEEMAELGGGEMLHQEDPHQDVEVEMMVHQEGVLLLEGILEKEMVVDPGDQAQGVDLPLVEDLVMMDPLIGAATDLLPVTTLHLPNQDQPVNTKMKAGRLSSVRPSASW